MALCKECKSCNWEQIIRLEQEEAHLYQCKKCKRVVAIQYNTDPYPYPDPNYEYNNKELI